MASAFRQRGSPAAQTANLSPVPGCLFARSSDLGCEKSTLGLRLVSWFVLGPMLTTDDRQQYPNRRHHSPHGVDPGNRSPGGNEGGACGGARVAGGGGGICRVSHNALTQRLTDQWHMRNLCRPAHIDRQHLDWTNGFKDLHRQSLHAKCEVDLLSPATGVFSAKHFETCSP